MTRLGLRHDYRLTLERLRQLHVPFVTTIGNHDAISNGKQVYREMFGPFDYTFDYGGVRFVCFNANRLEFSPDPPDLAWLDAATRPTPGVEAVVALSHQASTQSEYFDILRHNGVLALITAHDHRLEIERLGELVLVSVDDAWSRHWSVVTIADGELTVESCTRQGCVVQTP